MVGDEGARGEYLQTLRRESQRLARIVENVLAYARIGSSKRVRQAAPVELAGLVERVRPALEARAGQDGFSVHVSVDDDAAGVRSHADPDVIERILVNLVDNACKYASSGERRIDIHLSREGRMLALRVRDQGPGVASGDRHSIFSPFARGRGDDAVPGLGLGLALARGLAREMGGELRLGAGGPGATFVLTVPAAG
jgi:signal transduction histidine kinase